MSEPRRKTVWRCERCGHVLGEWMWVNRDGCRVMRMMLNHPCLELSPSAAFVECPVCGRCNGWHLTRRPSCAIIPSQ